MKTDRRHELQQNDLADWLAKWIEKAKPYSRGIVGGGLLLAVALFAFTYLRSGTQDRVSDSWNSYYAASTQRDPELLLKVAKTYSGTKAAMWAKQSAADSFLLQGTRDLFRDRGAAEENIKQAQLYYTDVAVDAKHEMLKQRAHFGLAQAHEAWNELAEAKDQYKILIADWPDTTIGRKAKERLANLEDQSTQDFYAWFFEQKPKPFDAAASNREALYGNLPSDPDLGSPNVPSGSPLGLPSINDELNSDAGADEPSASELLDTTRAEDGLDGGGESTTEHDLNLDAEANETTTPPANNDTDVEPSAEAPNP